MTRILRVACNININNRATQKEEVYRIAVSCERADKYAKTDVTTAGEQRRPELPEEQFRTKQDRWGDQRRLPIKKATSKRAIKRTARFHNRSANG